MLVDHLTERREPASFLHLTAAALQELTAAHALHEAGQDMEADLRASRVQIETALRAADELVHLSVGESIEAGTWGLAAWPEAETLSDRAEILSVSFLQHNRACSLIEIEQEIFRGLPGLFAPSRQTILAILSSYAESVEAGWRIRAEDLATQRRDDLRRVLGGHRGNRGAA